MRGHIIKRGKKYTIVVDLGRNHKNKRKQKWFSGYEKKKDAEKDLPNILNKLEKGYTDPANMTLKEYFNQWLDRKKNTVAPGTYEHYESYMRKHIIPGIGDWKISKLESYHIESFMDEINDKKLSQRSKKHIFRILSSALAKGKRYGITEGIMEDIEAPKVDKREIEYWTEDEVQNFMNSLKSKNHAIPILLSLATGMRRGEVLGLRWSKIDFNNKTISVTHQLKKDENGEWELSPQLKTSTSYRTIKIDDDTIDILKQHQRQQEKDKMKCGEDYINKDLVCATSIGDYIRPTYLRTVFNRTIDKSKVNKISFHGLRHTHATLLLKMGIHPKVVQERLGHRSIQTTLDTYSHIIPGIQEIAATSIQKSLYGEKDAKPENVVSLVKN
ncbi:site-specific integrase [Oceanobacillus kimchii]|uniref:site-specific integrase n=1 Tax=Oceanobacillus kimchii TaxID=746691 RepID=UPI0021A912B7|nr:site-specific integrase [Oceanobacillus kimchii]MCT1577986.1 site-specific integrase [Oceanobacillus kimchii]MCT2137546.1 site-specific integrase [Oceanobacillus kimchii]